MEEPVCRALNVFLLFSGCWGHGGSPQGWQGRAVCDTDGQPSDHCGGVAGPGPGCGAEPCSGLGSGPPRAAGSTMVTGQGRNDGGGPWSRQEAMSGSGLVAVTRVSHGPVMARQAKLGVSLGIKAEAEWGCLWACNWSRAQWDSLR